MKQKKKKVDYSKWGYLFILPFFISFFIFSFIPLIDTIRYSFFEYYRSGIKEVGPNFGNGKLCKPFRVGYVKIRGKHHDLMGDRIYPADRHRAGACGVVCGRAVKDPWDTVF